VAPVATKKAPAKKQESSSDSSSDEPAPPKKAALVSKAPPKKQASSSESDSSSDEPAPPKKAAPAAPAKKTAPAKKQESSSSDSDSESDKPAPKKAPAKQAAKKKESSSDDDSDSSEDAPPKKASRKNSDVKPKETKAANAEEGGNCEIFIKSLSFDIDEPTLASIFGKYGTTTKVKLIMSGGRSKGIAFVEYDNAKSAEAAVEGENGAEHFGRQISVEISGNKPQPNGPTSAAPGESTCIFCGNMSFYSTEDSVRAFFGQAGNVTQVRIAMGEDGRARGFCHVEFETPEQATAAMKLNG
jgi:nucleolin